MQQSESLVLLSGSHSQFSPPQENHSHLTQYSNGTHIDTSYPDYQNAIPQRTFIPQTASNTTIEAHNGETPAVNNKHYCPFPGCRQSSKEYAASDLKFVPHTHIHILDANRFLEGI